MMSDSKVKERVVYGCTKADPGLTIVPNKAYITFLLYIHPFSTLRLTAIFNLTLSDVNIMLDRYLIQNESKVFLETTSTLRLAAILDKTRVKVFLNQHLLKIKMPHPLKHQNRNTHI
jgi:hypothetical protein